MGWEPSGLVIVPVITGFVEVACRLRLPIGYATSLAVPLGLLISMAAAVADGVATELREGREVT